MTRDATDRLQELLLQIAGVPGAGAPLDDGFAALHSGIDALYQELDATTLDRERVEGIFDAMSDVVLVVDRDGRITRANSRAEQLLGYSREQLLGMRLSDIVEVIAQPQSASEASGQPGSP